MVQSTMCDQCFLYPAVKLSVFVISSNGRKHVLQKKLKIMAD